jgi:hypothetical protein
MPLEAPVTIAAFSAAISHPSCSEPSRAPPVPAAAGGAYLDRAAAPGLDSKLNVVEQAGFTMFLSRRSQGTLVLCVAAGAFAAAGPAYAMGGGSPKVKATPHKVMVNTTVALKGKHFAPNTTIKLLECGKTFWLAPSNPCLEENAKEVTTDAKGRFETSFKAGVCPEAERTKHPTEVVCYVGEVVFGEDTGELVGAGKVFVSYP